MATVETVARTVQAAISSEADYLLIAQWISDRYAQVAAKARFRHLRRLGAFTAPALIQALASACSAVLDAKEEPAA